MSYGSDSAKDQSDLVLRQDKQDEDSRTQYRPQRERLRTISYPETCQRCGRDLGRVYVLNGKRLCKSCMEAAQDTWVLFTGGPGSTKQRVSFRPLKREKEVSFIEALISGLLARMGLQRIVKEAGIVEKIPILGPTILLIARPDKKQLPKTEGIMNRKKSASAKSG